jgi:hypothetical protein
MYDDSDVMDEPMFTISEIAEQLKIHRTTAGRLFVGEPDVVRLGSDPASGKRQHYTVRVPLHVVQRVLGRLTVAK